MSRITVYGRLWNTPAKKALLVCVASVAIALAVVAILLGTLDINRFRPMIQADLQRQLHRPVALGKIELGYFPLSIRVSDVQIGESSAFPTGRPFITARKIRVRAQMLALLRKTVRVTSLELKQPSIELVANSARQWNWADLISESSQGGATGLSELRIVDGSLSLSDLAMPSSRTVYDHIGVRLTDFAPGRTYHLKASVQLPGAKPDSVVLEGSGRSLTGTDIAFDGRLSLSRAPVAALGRLTGTVFPFDGLLSGTEDIHSAHSVTSSRGKLVLDHASVHGAAVAIPISADYEITNDWHSGIFQARTARIKAGNVVMNTSAQVNFGLNTINASVQTANANLTELLALGRILGARAVNGSGTISIDLAASGPMNGALNYTGSASIPAARISTGYAGGALAVRNAHIKFSGSTAIFSADSVSSRGMVFTNVRSTGALSHGVLALSPFAAQLFGGSATGTILVDTNSNPQSLALNLRLEGVDANELLSSATTVKNTVYGSLTASTNLRLRLYSAEQALARSANGSVTLRLTRGHLTSVNLMSELASMGRFVGYAPNSQRLTTIVKLAGDLGVVNGIASTSDLRLQTEGGSLAAVGFMNFADQTLNLRATAVLDRSTSHQVGGNHIGGFMQTALANGSGELVIPVTVTGTFAHPHLTPDGERMAELRLKSLLPTAASPERALTSIAGGAKQGGNALGNAIGSLFGKKKP